MTERMSEWGVLTVHPGLMLGSLLQRAPPPTPSCHLASGQLLPRREPEGNWKAGSGAQQAGGGRCPSSCFAAIPISMSAWPRHSPFPSIVCRLALVFSLILLSENQPHLPLEGPATCAHTHKRTCHSCAAHPHTLEVWIQLHGAPPPRICPNSDFFPLFP